jgi:hypothetical protein
MFGFPCEVPHWGSPWGGGDGPGELPHPQLGISFFSNPNRPIRTRIS